MNERAEKAMANPRRWLPGDVVIHRIGSVAVIHYRKQDDSGWQLVGSSGLADHAVLNSTDWTWWGPAPALGDEGVHA